MDYKTKKLLTSILIHTLLGVIVIICLFPVLWMCIISIKTVGESITGFNALRVTNPTLDNYRRLFELIPIWSNLYNSVFTSVVGTITTLFSVHWRAMLLPSTNSLGGMRCFILPWAQ